MPVTNKYEWYVLYVRYSHEKKVNQFFKEIGISAYLPLEKKLNYWSDRKKWVSCPLFPCYIFVYVSNIEFYRVFEHPSVIKYVSFEGKPASVSEKQIETIQKIIDTKQKYSIINSIIKTGTEVVLINGPLKGICGEVIGQSGSKRFIIRMRDIGYSLVMNLPEYMISVPELP